MLDRETVETIRQMLESGEFSQREIADKIGVSRGTVSAISRGSRTERFAGESDETDSPFEAGPPRRCPTCGGLVQMPCLACRTREMIATESCQASWGESADLGDRPDRHQCSMAGRNRTDRCDPRGRLQSRRRRRGGEDRRQIAGR